MKKFSFFKAIQLTLLIVLTGICIYMLIQPEMKQQIFASRPETVLFALVWVILLVSYICIFVDISLISSIKLGYHNLYGVAYADQLSGIPNRFSCDTIIEKYADMPLPFSVSAVVIVLTNLSDINTLYDHSVGNRMLKEFSSILSASAVSLCFIGRNGGNNFLAIFEDGNDDNVYNFLNRIEARVKKHNAAPDAVPIEYRTGVAMNSKERIKQITKLISMANKRAYRET